MRTACIAGIVLLSATLSRADGGSGVQNPTPANIHSEVVEYVCQGDTLVGNLAWDGSVEGKRPVVLVVHEWWGNNDYSRRRAEMLAEAGYLAMAVDLFGKGHRAQDPAGAMALTKFAYTRPELMTARMVAAMELATADSLADREQVAAIGYCFGGGILLEMARGGMDLDAVASFHGGLGTEKPAAAGSIKPAILVLHGEADPMVPAEEAEAFRKEMETAGARLEFVGYTGATHAFSNPKATETGKTFDIPIAYNEEADADSWKRLLVFLKTELK